jgi:CheY-like chemotaxis protein
LRSYFVSLVIGFPHLYFFEVALRLRADPRFAHVPLVAVTGYGMKADKERAREFGFAAHLTKPAEPDDLEATVKRLVARERPEER